MMTLEKFTRRHWEAGALLALKPSSARIYQFNLEKYVLPALGSLRMCDVNWLAITCHRPRPPVTAIRVDGS